MLEVLEIHKTFEGQPLLRGVSFTVSAGETICLLGPSGSGKSTLLRIIAGLENAERGSIRWNGEDLASFPVHKRQFGLMFQDYALFPHRTVAENVAFGLRMQGLPRQEIQARTLQALEQVTMSGFAGRRVTDLSGGEQQRVALARALAPQPRLLMLDEPLGALDKTLRAHLIDELRKLLHHTGIPAIYVTHDQEEAFSIADRLVLLHHGGVEQDGTPLDVYNRPATAWAAGFLGFSNLIPGKIAALDPLCVETATGLWLPGEAPVFSKSPGKPVTILLKPGGAQPANPAERVNVLEGIVQDVVFRGEGFRLDLTVDGVEYQFFQDQPLPVGDKIRLKIDPRAVVCLE